MTQNQRRLLRAVSRAYFAAVLLELEREALPFQDEIEVYESEVLE